MIIRRVLPKKKKQQQKTEQNKQTNKLFQYELLATDVCIIIYEVQFFLCVPRKTDSISGLQRKTNHPYLTKSERSYKSQLNLQGVSALQLPVRSSDVKYTDAYIRIYIGIQIANVPIQVINRAVRQTFETFNRPLSATFFIFK